MLRSDIIKSLFVGNLSLIGFEMSILDWFAKKDKVSEYSEKLNIPGDLWVQCFNCKETLFLKELETNHKVCMHCEYHFRLTSEDRIQMLFDEGSFVELNAGLRPKDFLNFVDTEPYSKRIERANNKSNVNEAVRTGTALLKGKAVNLCVMDFSYMGGSMGSVVGEKITRMIEFAVKDHNPLIIFSSSGGARMQEGVTSLMQMAKTSSALNHLSQEHVPFISVLCDPTTGGTSASFSMLGDINIAEPGALISFAGPRVIEQTIRQKIPKGFQRAEFLLKHGMVDLVVHRSNLRDKLFDLIRILDPREVSLFVASPILARYYRKKESQ